MTRSSTAGAARGRSARWLGAAALFWLACSSDTTDPGPSPGAVTFTYAPVNQEVVATVGRPLAFMVTVSGADSYEVAWTVDGEPAGAGREFTFVGDAVGAHVLAVSVEAGAASGGRTWNLDVRPDASRLPRTVAGLTVQHGDDAGQVRVAWVKDTTGFYELADYVVAVSYDGPVDDDSFDAAADTVVVPVQSTLGQSRLLTWQEHDIRPGERAWFAVRARDVLGQVSLVGETLSIDVTTAWNLELVVRDDAGIPLPAKAFRYRVVGTTTELNGVTRADGTARVDSLRSIDRVTVRTNTDDAPATGWYDFRTPDWGDGDGLLAITLVTRHPLAIEPCPTAVNPIAGFMDYLQRMTRSTGIPGTVPAQEDTLVLRWEDYPLGVYAVPALLPRADAELAPHAMAALEPWNAAAGTELLVAAPDSASADVVVVFSDPGFNRVGLTTMQDGTPVGASIPVQMIVYISPKQEIYWDLGEDPEVDPPHLQRATAITMHEFGHVLGLLAHSCSSSTGNLMDEGGLPKGLDGLDPSLWWTVIRPTEADAVRTVRFLPQATRTLSYEGP